MRRLSPAALLAIALVVVSLLGGGLFAAFRANVSAQAQQNAPAAREALTITAGNGPHTFQVEIADDTTERSRGLMFRRSMDDAQGMLFDFQSDQPASFWMRNTYIPLDMLFIRSDGTIESIARNTTPLSDTSVPSKGPVRFVLEINGGLSERLGIAAGDTIGGPAFEARR